MLIIFDKNWLSNSLLKTSGWAIKRYSPSWTNGNKLKSNLTKIGHVDRGEWRKNNELVLDAINDDSYNYNLKDIRIIKVMNLEIQDACLLLHCHIEIHDLMQFQCGFIVSNTLNLHEVNYTQPVNIPLQTVITVLSPHDEDLSGSDSNDSDEVALEDYDKAKLDDEQSLKQKADKAGIDWLEELGIPDNCDDEQSLKQKPHKWGIVLMENHSIFSKPKTDHEAEPILPIDYQNGPVINRI